MGRTELVALRKAQDAEMIRSRDRWPGPFLHLKTQPWVQTRRHGVLAIIDEDPRYPDEPTTFQIMIKDPETGRLTGEAEEFFATDLARMVETWSVD